MVVVAGLLQTLTDWGQCDLGATIVPVKNAQFADFMQGLCQQDLASKWPKQVLVSQQNTGLPPVLEPFDSDREFYVFNRKNARSMFTLDKKR